MPYGRKSYTKRTTRRYGTRKPSYRRKAVRPPPKRKTQRTYVRKNAYAINRVARKVNFLMNARWGQVQKNLHISDPIVPIAGAPFAFDATNFTCRRLNDQGSEISPGAIIYQVNAAGTGVTNAGKFNIDTADMLNNPYWDAVNRDLAGDTGAYKPIRATYTFQIKGRPSLDDTWIDIRLLAHRPGTLNPSPVAQARMMPFGLVYMKRLTGIDNDINYSYFKQYYHKRIYLNSQTYNQPATPAQGLPADGTIGATATTGNTKYVRMTIRPKKVRTQTVTWPETPGDSQVPDPNQSGEQWATDGAYSELNCPPEQTLWCVVSCNDQSAILGDALIIKMKREVVWRDGMGNSAVTN